MLRFFRERVLWPAAPSGSSFEKGVCDSFQSWQKVHDGLEWVLEKLEKFLGKKVFPEVMKDLKSLGSAAFGWLLGAFGVVWQ